MGLDRWKSRKGSALKVEVDKGEAFQVRRNVRTMALVRKLFAGQAWTRAEFV